jgi:hypothetical protein
MHEVALFQGNIDALNQVIGLPLNILNRLTQSKPEETPPSY